MNTVAVLGEGPGGDGPGPRAFCASVGPRALTPNYDFFRLFASKLPKLRQFCLKITEMLMLGRTFSQDMENVSL